MDFNMLARRDLQALCKRNKIPANITNVAMAEALKALEFVEGIEEFSETCQSETAQSSIESPGKLEVTSPYVPATGGRSTRRRNVAKDEPETAKPSARAPRTTRKAAVTTPAVVSQSSKKKVQIVSACKKMDFESKECIDEEKSGVSATPAPSAVTTRRRRAAKEESTVSHVYSTRRSTRLAVKNIELSNEVGSENPDFSKKELFTNDCQDSKSVSNEGSIEDEVSGTTGGVDAEDVTMEVNSEKAVETEVVSVEIQDVSAIDMVEEPVPAIEDDKSNQSEADGAKLELNDACCDVVSEEVGFGSKTEAEAVSAEKEVEADVVSEVEADVVSEVEADVVSAEKQDMSTIVMEEQVPAIEDEVSNQSEADDAKFELMDTCDVKIEEVGFGFEAEAETEKEESGETEAPKDEIKAEEKDGTLDDVKATETGDEVVEMEQNQAVNYGDNIVKSEEKGTDEDVLENEDKFTDNEASEDETEENVSDEDSEDDETEENVSNVDTEDVSQLNVNMEVLEINANVDGELGEEKEIKPDDASDSVTLDQNTDDLSSEISLDIGLMNEEEESSTWETVFAYVNEKHEAVVEDETKDAGVLPGSAPVKACAKKARTPAVSDNKENNIIKTNELEEKLKQLSVRKLTKMLKEKLNITNKSSVNENGNEVVVPVARQALQALPENRKA